MVAPRRSLGLNRRDVAYDVVRILLYAGHEVRWKNWVGQWFANRVYDTCRAKGGSMLSCRGNQTMALTTLTAPIK